MKGRILIVQLDAHLTGSAFSGLILANGLREAGWETVVVFGHDGPIIDRYKAASHHVKIVPHKNWIRTDRLMHFAKVIATELKAANTFEDVIKEVDPEAVYINTSVSFAAARAANKLGYRVIWHLRELFADVGGEMKVPFGLKWGIRSVLKSYAQVRVAISNAVATNMLGNARKHVHIVPNAVSDSFFTYARNEQQARRVLGLPQEGAIIGVPGTLRPMKGHPFFFEAIASLIHDHPGLTIAVTGGGEGRYVAELKRMVEALDISSNVLFLGYVEDMPAFYRACNVVCIPSRAEPFGRTVIEAFATGVPVIASSVGGIKEIVDHEENGLLVNYGDKAALAATLLRVLEDKELAARLRKNALQKAKSHYHEDVYKARISQIVSDVCETQDEYEPVLNA